MILVIGGHASGKRAWVEDNLGYTPTMMTNNPLEHLPVLYGLESSDVSDASQLEAFEVVICDEIGCGIVPISAEERARRERIGRLCCDLARTSHTVVRVTCGIGVYIKGSQAMVCHQ